MAANREIRELARRIKSLERAALDRKQPTLGFSAIEDGAITSVDDDDNLVMVIGKQFDGTQTSAVVTGPVPPTPQAPLVTEGLQNLRVYWDGTWADEAAVAPMDFARVTVHATPTSLFDGADPIDQRWIVGVLPTATGGEITASLPPVEHTVYLVAWSEAGKFSEASVLEFGTPGDPDDLAANPPPKPTSSPTPAPLAGPAAVVVNFEPIERTDVDLHMWIPPPLGDEETEYETPTDPPNLTTLHTASISNGTFVYTDIGGQPLPVGRPIWVALWAHNESGAADSPSAWVETNVGQVDPAYLQLLVGTLLAERLQGETVQGVHLVGSTLDIEGALYAEPNYMEVRADSLEAKAAVFEDNVRRRGLNNFLEGREVASAGVQDPGVPPTVENYWPEVELSTGAGLFYSGDPFINEMIVLRTGPEFDIYNRATGAFLRNETGGWFDVALDAVRKGDWYYVIVVPFMGEDYRLYRYSAISGSGVATRDESYDFAIANVNGVWGQSSIACDIDEETGYLWFVRVNSLGKYQFRVINPETQAVIKGWTTLPGADSGSDASIVGCSITNPLGLGFTLRVWRSFSDERRWETGVGGSMDSFFSMAGTERVRPYGKSLAAAADDHSLDNTGRAYRHTASWNNYGSLEFKYTWYDSDTGGLGTAETLPSPARNFDPAPGAYVRVRVSSPPDDGTNDAPNTARLYVNGDRDTNGNGQQFSQAELEGGRVLTVFSNSGLTPPSESGFKDRVTTAVGGYESAIANEDGDPVWQLNGDGSGHVGPYSWNSDGIANEAITLTPSMSLPSGVVLQSHDIKIRQISPGVVGIVGYLDIDGGAVTRRSTGMVVPEGMRPTSNVILGYTTYGTSTDYRYFINTDGVIEFEMSAGAGPFEAVNGFWFTN